MNISRSSGGATLLALLCCFIYCTPLNAFSVLNAIKQASTSTFARKLFLNGKPKLSDGSFMGKFSKLPESATGTTFNASSSVGWSDERPKKLEDTSNAKCSKEENLQSPQGVFDLLVIGAGSGGVAAAVRASEKGAKVAIIEQGALGGTCVNVGCIPKKLLYHTAELMQMFDCSKHYGFDKEKEITFSWPRNMNTRRSYIEKLNGIYDRKLKNSNVSIINGTASFTGVNSVRVGSEEYKAKHILIATGSSPLMPKIEGIENCITSDHFFSLEQQPRKVAVVGAGYIAVEIAGVLNSLKSDVSLFVRGANALRKFDKSVSSLLHHEMQRSGIKVITKAIPKWIKRLSKDNLQISLEDGRKMKDFDSILMAVGRVPNIASLGLENAHVGVRTLLDSNENAYIEVDEYQNTNIPGIYAIGDVTGKTPLTPVAIAAGRKLADRLFNNEVDAKISYDLVPTVVFSHPVIGAIGLTEEEARMKYGDDELKVYESSFVNLFYGMWQETGEKPRSNVKMICVGPNERVVGLHLIGDGADEALQGFTVAMKMGATKADFDKAIAIHPTFAEEIVTLKPWSQKKKKIDFK